MAEHPRPTNTRQPDPVQLQAAVALVVDRLRPDQIILYGSAVQGEMTASSDLDLLVIRNPDDRGGAVETHEHWCCGDVDDLQGIELDVVVTDGATAEKRRRSAAFVQGAALEAGRTVYVRDGATPLRTGPIHAENGAMMARTTLYEPDYADEWLGRAAEKWTAANLEGMADLPATRCQMLQESMELALKALIVAQGRRVQHTHDLAELRKQVEAHGERIAALLDTTDLSTLSKYAGGGQHPTHEPIDPEATFAATRRVGEDVLHHARLRVPALVDETKRKLRPVTPAENPR